MSTPTAIFTGLALIAAAIYLGNAQPAISQAADLSNWGPWNVKVEKPDQVAWKLNSSNGEMYFCTKTDCTKLPTK
jgi:hypothetical protein